MPPTPSVLLLAAALAAPAAAQCPYGNLSSGRYALSATGVGGRALFAGGADAAGPSDRVDVLDVATGAWTTGTLSAARTTPAAVAVGGRALFAGGVVTNTLFQSTHFDEVDVYDAASGTWSTATLSRARSGIAAAASGGRAWFAGGFEGLGPVLTPLATIDVYDSATGQWSTGSLSVARAYASAVAVGGEVIVAGGYSASGSSDVVEILDVASGQWSTATLSVGRGELAGVAVGDYAIFAGGWSGGSLSDAVDVYDASTGLWSTATLSEARGAIQAVAVGSLAIFAGGSPGASSAVDVFDAATGLWSTAELAQPRALGAWAAVGDEAFLAGGFDGSLAPLLDDVVRWTAGLPSPYAFGGAASCPCANDGGAQAGCASSLGVGARLRGSGCPSASAGGFALEVTQLPPGRPALLFSGTPAAAQPFGDGLLAVARPYRRVGTQVADASGAATWSSGLAHLAAPGQALALQAHYRDASGPCGSGVNLSNAVRVVLGP